MSEHTKYNQALRCYLDNEMEQAHTLIQEILVETQDDPDVWCLEAQVQLAREEWQSADFAVEQALMIAGDTFAPHFIRANLYNNSERFEEACEAALTSIEFANNNQEARDGWLLLAEARFHTGMIQIQEAAEVADEGEPLIMEPETAEVLQQGQEAVEKAIELDASYAESWELSANFCAIFEDNEGALRAWRNAVELEPGNPEYLHGLGQALEDLEDFEEAHAIFQELYELEKALFEEAAQPLLFAPEEFSTVARDIWAEIEHNEIDESMELVFEFDVDIYPSEALMDESSPEALFDPRVGVHVEFVVDPFSSVSDNPAPPIVRMHMFQRNIERELEGGDIDELRHEIESTLGNFVDQIYEYMGGDEEEW